MSIAISNSPIIGSQPVSNFVLTGTNRQTHPLGTILEAADPFYGAGEYIYLQAATSIDAGYVVVWDADFFATLCPIDPNTNREIAISTLPCPLGGFAWFQISGQTPVRSTDIHIGDKCGISATIPGTIDVFAADGRLIQNSSIVRQTSFGFARTANVQGGQSVVQVTSSFGTIGVISGLSVTEAGGAIPGGTFVGPIDQDARISLVDASGLPVLPTTNGSTLLFSFAGFSVIAINRSFIQGV